jgi:DNA-binding transcriptional LysR family regulator
MRVAHLRQADLNLLIVFAVLAEERNISRAAARLFLSQPAASRALQRLRDMFRDDLLIRTSSGYEPTPKGQRLLRELETILPRLDRLISGKDFDPETDEASFRIVGTDHASHLVCPHLCRMTFPSARHVSFHFLPLYDAQFDATERGRVDLLIMDRMGLRPAMRD